MEIIITQPTNSVVTKIIFQNKEVIFFKVIFKVSIPKLFSGLPQLVDNIALYIHTGSLRVFKKWQFFLYILMYLN